jgi:uncharacterized protein
MKRALILHGTKVDHTANWFPWLKGELENLGYEVWVPDLPHAERPNISRYNEFLLDQGWDFSDNLVIGHSSGSLAALGLLEALPDDVRAGNVFLLGSFAERLADDPAWPILKELFEKPFDFARIKRKAAKFMFMHSDNDPYCPLDQAKELHGKLGGEFILMPGMGHFSAELDPKFKEFPELLELIKKEEASAS